jgi:CPA2 family monovalent cation:H+ antiporter-2
MLDAPLLRDLVFLLAASLPVVFVARRLGLPALVGFLLTGILIGPNGLGVVESAERVQLLAEVGVVLLLFTVGLEFSLSRLAKMGRLLLGAGTLQVVVTTLVAGAGAFAMGYELASATVFGFAMALSSTALTLTVLESRGDFEAPYAGPMLAVLLFQDLCILPMMTVLPLMAGTGAVPVGSALARFAAAVGTVGAIVYVARTALPKLLHQVLKLRSRELFIGVIVLACFGTAWLTAELGLSLAIGAFLAGLVVSESEYSHQVVADVLPLRDLFSSVFFVSIGMMFAPALLVERPGTILVLCAGVMLFKSIIGAASILPFHASPGVVALAGVGLAQVGEFSFVLTLEAAHLGLLTAADVELVVAVAVVTMLLSPMFVDAVSRVVSTRDLSALTPFSSASGDETPRGHVVVVGYGHNGRNLTRVLKQAGIPYRIVDVDLDAVRIGKDIGDPVAFGDATRSVVLEHLHADKAAAVAVTFAHPTVVPRVISAARALSRHAAIVVRTRYVDDLDALYALGATEVIPEEFEASVDMFSRLLQCLEVPKNVIAAQVDVIRAQHYAMLRGRGGTRSYLESLFELFTAATAVTHLIRADSPAIGATLGALDLKTGTGVSLAAVVRRGQATASPSADFRIEKGDILVMTGSHAQLAAARERLDPPSVAEEAR